eukprot:1149462-Pyramimonas_sp.AAC.1
MTSGNELIRQFFTKATGIPCGSEYIEKGKSMVGVITYEPTEPPSKNNVIVEYRTETPRNLQARPTLLKTHYPSTEDGYKARPHRFDHRCATKRHFAGIVHLARNPVDNIVGNAVRWGCTHHLPRGSRGSLTQYRSCMSQKISNGVCNARLPWNHKAIENWNRFHLYWMQVASSQQVPYHVLRYEDAARDPEATFSKLFDFMGVDSAPLLDQALEWQSTQSSKSSNPGKLSKCDDSRVEDYILQHTAYAAQLLGYPGYSLPQNRTAYIDEPSEP